MWRKCSCFLEIAEKVNQSEGRKEIRHLLITRVLKAANICVQVTYDNMVPPQEAVDHLFNIKNVIKI